EREDRGRTLVLRRRVHNWTAAEWNGPASSRETAEATGSCFGGGSGFFEWKFDDEAIAQLRQARRIRILCEVSARRSDTPQTGAHRHPTNFELWVNGLVVHRAMLPDHPHDTRGALSYLRGGLGAYGYLMRASIEENLLQRVAEIAAADGALRLRCVVPDTAAAPGGLTVYDFDCGRFPIAPTIVIEWDQT
ncbi:MAG: glycoside hydrolase family 2, partial [Opitutaceae bacterium]